MQIAGIQKFSLSDYPGQPAAVIFTRGCNLRCPWCHNPSLVYPEKYGPLIPKNNILSFLESRQGKLNAVVISGGEPTIQADLPEFLKKLKDMDFLVKLDTNGTRPEVLKSILKNRLVDCFAVDYKTEISKYPLLTGNNNKLLWEQQLMLSVETSILLALADSRGYIRTTMIPGTNLKSMAEHFKALEVTPGSSKWILQNYRKRKEAK